MSSVYVKGKLSWVRHDRPNEWGKYTVTLHPDTPSLEIIRELQAEGVKNQIKKDEEGYYVTFSRPVSKEIKGRIVTFSPVELLDGRQPPLPDGSFPPLRDVLVGNGSDGVVKLETFYHRTPGTNGKAMAARLAAIRVDNLVPFDKQSRTEEELFQIKGLEEQPKEQLF